MKYPEDYVDKVIQGDCLELMKEIPDKSIDMILCDLPYGITECEWDNTIPLEPLWLQYTRIIKDKNAIVLFGSQPFSAKLIMSNLEMFKYEWIWHKSRPTGHVHAKNKPLKTHENILIFSKGTTVHENQSINRMIYNPQFLIKINKRNNRPGISISGSAVIAGRRHSSKITPIQEYTNYPRSILYYNNDHNVNAYHPTQKPIALLEYLVNTYTNENDLVLDNCIGGGSTAIACINTNRHYIGMELSQDYCNVANKRIEQTKLDKKKQDRQINMF